MNDIGSLVGLISFGRCFINETSSFIIVQNLNFFESEFYQSKGFKCSIIDYLDS